jgi:uncharacterized membrane protein
MPPATSQADAVAARTASPLFVDHAVIRPSAMATSRYWAAVVVILLVGLAFRAWNLGGADFWTDEVLTSLRANVPLDEAIDSILGAGNQAPIYYMMMQVLPHSSDVLLRLPAMILGVVNIALLMFMITRLYGDRLLALEVGALLAVNPLHVILSRTARFYTLLFVFSMLFTYLFILLLRGQRTRRVWIAFWLCSMFAYMTHYSSLALPAAQGLLLVVLWRRTREMWIPWGIAQAAAVAPALLWMLVATGEYEPVGYVGMAHPPVISDLPITLLNLLEGFDGSWSWWVVPGVVLGTIGIAAGVVALVRTWRPQPDRLYWITSSVVPVLALFIMGITVYSKYKDRYMLLLGPSVMLLFVVGWRWIAPRWSRAAVAVVVLTGALLSVQLFTSGSYQRTDWSDAGRFMDEHFEPGDRVLFARTTTLDAFEHSYRGSDDVLDGAFLLTETPDTEAVERSATRIWVIYRDQWEDFHRQGWVRDFDPLRRGLSDMSNWLVDRQDRIVGQTSFDGIVIYEMAPLD